MFENWFKPRESRAKDTEEKQKEERRSFFEKQKQQEDVRKRITTELNRPELEEVALKIYKLHSKLSVADPADTAYVQPNPERAASVRKEIDELVETHAKELAEYMKLKQEKYARGGVINPGYVDAEVALALFRKGLMEEWRWESDPADRFWEGGKE